jgi:hypothetical protein
MHSHAGQVGERAPGLWQRTIEVVPEDGPADQEGGGPQACCLPRACCWRRAPRGPGRAHGSCSCRAAAHRTRSSDSLLQEAGSWPRNLLSARFLQRGAAESSGHSQGRPGCCSGLQGRGRRDEGPAGSRETCPGVPGCPMGQGCQSSACGARFARQTHSSCKAVSLLHDSGRGPPTPKPWMKLQGGGGGSVDRH